MSKDTVTNLNAKTIKVRSVLRSLLVAHKGLIAELEEDIAKIDEMSHNADYQVDAAAHIALERTTHHAKNHFMTTSNMHALMELKVAMVEYTKEH